MRQVSGTKLFPYFGEFMVTMGTKFGYNSFIKFVLHMSNLYRNLNQLVWIGITQEMV